MVRSTGDCEACEADEGQIPDTFMAEIQQGRYPLFPVEGREMNFYVDIE